MDLPDLLGPALCHQLNWRTMDGAWLCDRCTGLYSGGLVGVALGWLAARKLRLVWLLLLVVVLHAPVLVDKLLLGLYSPLDVTAWRITTGFLGGLGLGLLFASRAAVSATWPAAEHLASWRPFVGVMSLLAASVVLFALGVTIPVDAVVFLGLVALCLTATAWALGLLRRLPPRSREAAKASGPPPPARLGTLATLVVVELIVVTVTPNEYKPHIGWLWEALSWVGVGPRA